ncbi:LLM class flavin-dependent oxidoreductase [Streptomyces mirabilis]|uniref:LLM class flavin-dependent oxidoreductase n=1 Tax=Streptomyces mirabilis TaxID=68239 RepID=UPI0036BABEF0
MRFFFYNNPQTPGPEADTRIIDAIVEQSIWADQAGFDAITLTEHHFDNYNTYSNAFMMAAFLAPQLTQATLMLAVTVPAAQHPIELAERANLLDQLTKGRAVIGVGPGSSPVEFAGLGRDHQTRHAAMDEALEIVHQAWALKQDTPPLKYSTRHDSGEVLGRVMPSPYGGKPTPRLARATLSDDGLSWAGRRGLPVFFGRFPAPVIGEKLDLYRRALEEAGHSADTLAESMRWSFVQKMVYVADSDEQALADLAEPIAFSQSLLGRAFGPPSGGPVAEGHDMRKAVGAAAGSLTEFLAASAFYGTPDTVASQIEELVPSGLQNLACWMYFGDMPLTKVNRSMELFINEVMPRFDKR